MLVFLQRWPLLLLAVGWCTECSKAVTTGSAHIGLVPSIVIFLLLLMMIFIAGEGKVRWPWWFVQVTLCALAYLAALAPHQAQLSLELDHEAQSLVLTSADAYLTELERYQDEWLNQGLVRHGCVIAPQTVECRTLRKEQSELTGSRRLSEMPVHAPKEVPVRTSARLESIKAAERWLLQRGVFPRRWNPPSDKANSSLWTMTVWMWRHPAHEVTSQFVLVLWLYLLLQILVHIYAELRIRLVAAALDALKETALAKQAETAVPEPPEQKAEFQLPEDARPK